MKQSYRILSALIIVSLCLAAGCSKSPEEKRAAFLKSAEGYVSEGKYAEASIQYKNSLKIAPDDVKTLMALGEVEIKLLRANEAYKIYSKVVSIDPKNTKAREYLASMQLLAKKYDMSEKEALAILKLEPDNINAKEILAQSLFQTGKRDEAVRIMEEILAKPKPSEATFLNTAQMYMATSRADEALALIQKGAAQYTGSSKIRFLASDIYAFKGDLNLARTWAEAAYNADKKGINAGIALARFYSGHKMDDQFNALLNDLKTRFPKDASPYILEASVMRQKGQTDKALSLAEKAVGLQDTPLNKTIVAQLLMEKGEKQKAEKILTEVIAKDNKSVTSRVLLAQLYLQENKPQKALETLDTLLKNIPGRPDIVVPAAQAYLMKGDVVKARELVSKALTTYKDNAMLHATMAKIFYAEGKFEETLSEVDLLTKNSFYSPDILYIGTLSALRANQKEKAASYSDALQKAAPDSWQALHAQISIAVSKSDKQGAYRLAEKAVNLYPEKGQALILFAGIAPSVISKEETIKKIRSICEKSNTSVCRLILARVLEATGDKNGALAQMNEAIKLEDDNTSLYHALAQFYTRNNMMKQAIGEYESIVNKKPDDLRAALMLALLNQGQGNIADAKKVYTYILEREPKNALAANNLAWILAESGKESELNEAMRLAQIAKDKYPDDPRIADTLGYVFLKKGLFDNALSQFRLAQEKLGQEPSVNYHMAMALSSLKKPGEAKKYLSTALSAKTAFPERAEAQKLMATLSSGSK